MNWPNLKAKIGGFPLQTLQVLGVAGWFGSAVSKMAVSGAKWRGILVSSTRGAGGGQTLVVKQDAICDRGHSSTILVMLGAEGNGRLHAWH